MAAGRGEPKGESMPILTIISDYKAARSDLGGREAVNLIGLDPEEARKRMDEIAERLRNAGWTVIDLRPKSA